MCLKWGLNLKLAPSFVFLCTPPNNINKIPCEIKDGCTVYEVIRVIRVIKATRTSQHTHTHTHNTHDTHTSLSLLPSPSLSIQQVLKHPAAPWWVHGVVAHRPLRHLHVWRLLQHRCGGEAVVLARAVSGSGRQCKGELLLLLLVVRLSSESTAATTATAAKTKQ